MNGHRRDVADLGLPLPDRGLLLPEQVREIAAEREEQRGRMGCDLDVRGLLHVGEGDVALGELREHDPLEVIVGDCIHRSFLAAASRAGFKWPIQPSASAAAASASASLPGVTTVAEPAASRTAFSQSGRAGQMTIFIPYASGSLKATICVSQR